MIARFFCWLQGGQNFAGWSAMVTHSNQANLIVGGLRHRRHQQTRQAPILKRIDHDCQVEAPGEQVDTAGCTIVWSAHV
jgi:hypothetical protein